MHTDCMERSAAAHLHRNWEMGHSSSSGMVQQQQLAPAPSAVVPPSAAPSAPAPAGFPFSLAQALQQAMQGRVLDMWTRLPPTTPAALQHQSKLKCCTNLPGCSASTCHCPDLVQGWQRLLQRRRHRHNRSSSLLRARACQGIFSRPCKVRVGRALSWGECDVCVWAAPQPSGAAF